MEEGAILLGIPGQEITLPAAGRLVVPQPVEIVKSQRAASGKLREQIVRRYTDYQINYELLTGEQWDQLQTLYNLQQYLNLIVYNRDGSTATETVKLHPITGTREEARGSWIWSGVTVTLEAV